MPKERNAFKLGLTLIAFFVLFVAVMVFLIRRGGDLRLVVRYPHDELRTVLKPGGEVACGGKVVGSVDSVRLQEMPGPAGGPTRLYALVAVQVDSSLGLRRDCRFVPEELLLGGPGKLVIADRGTGAPVSAGDVVEGSAGAGLAGASRMLAAQLDPRDPDSLVALMHAQLDPADVRSLVNRTHASLNDLTALTQSISKEVDPTQTAAALTKLHAILDHVDEITRLLRREVDAPSDRPLMARLHESLDSLNDGLITATAMLKENREPLADAVGNVRRASEVFEQQIAVRIAAQLDTAQQASLMAKVHVAIDRLGDSVRDMNTITGHTRELVLANKEQLNRSLGNLKEASDHLKSASKEIRRSPWRLLYQPTIEEARQAGVLDSARAFAEAATRLDDAVVRLEAMSQPGATTQPAGDEQLTQIREQLQQTFSKFSKAEAVLWDSLNVK